MIKKANPLTPLLAIICILLFSNSLRAQSIDANPKAAIDATKMIESSNSKIYRARVLLEDYRNWPQSYELIRDVIKNDDTLNKVAKKKLEKAAGQIKYYLPSKWFSRTINSRHLIRPFLEASYLINEALMDSRIALNSSSDSEVPFVEQLLKSYFFPGNESAGRIEYPELDTYAFDLYSLTEKNIAQAKRERSDEENASGNNNDSDNNPANPPHLGGPRRDPRVGDYDLDDQQLNTRYKASNGFVLDLISKGVEISEITKEVSDLIKRYQVPKRVHNRYLELSLLLQAVVDPGTVLFDPQLQGFLKGVRLKVALGQTDNSAADELLSLRSELGNRAVVKTDDEVRVRLSYLMDMQRNNPYAKNGIELSLKEVKGTGRSILYAISTVSGEEQLALRTLQMAATIARDADQIKVVGTTLRAYPAIAKLQSLANISLSKLAAALPAAARAVNEMAIATNRGAIGASLRSLSWTLKGIVSIQNVGVKISQNLSPKALKLLAAAKNNKYVKNGSATGILTLAAAATQITIGVIEYRATDDTDEKFDIYIDTTARVAATATYMLPVVGWAAAALDLGHAFLGVPFETADVYKGYAWFVGEITLSFYGLSSVKVKMIEAEAALNLPRNNIFFERYGKLRRNEVASYESTKKSLVNLRAELQQVALNEMSFLYIAHRTFASSTDYSFGERIETHHRSLISNLKMVASIETMLNERLLEFGDVASNDEN